MAILTELIRPTGKYSHGCVYLIRNKINGKKYIGQTIQKNPSLRWRYHIKYYPKNPSLIQKAIRKYGVDNFDFEVLVYCSEQQSLNQLEDFFIEKYDALAPKGYTCLGSKDRTNVVSDQMRKKVSDANKGRPSWIKGKKMPESAVLNMRIAAKTRDWSYLKGRKLSESHKAKCRIAMLGKKHSPETREKMSLQKKGKKQNLTPEQRQAKRDRMLGKKLPQYHCDAIGRSKKGIISKRRVPIMCIETGKVYSHAAEAAKELCVHKNAIVNNMAGLTKKTRNNYSFKRMG